VQQAEFLDYMDECRELVVAEIRDLLPKADRYRPVLYDLILDYPLRDAKAIRPSLCVATCRALGGRMEAVLRSAAVLEFYHNAFLIHDDVEDGSEFRRDAPTLHRKHGVPIAVNVGDAMLALALEPLLENMASLGLGKAIRILQLVGRMARESAEGQALELGWIRAQAWALDDADYLRMVYKKTAWYTFVAPMLVGAIVAGAEPACLVALRKFAVSIGLAFQIQDDVLNLTGDPKRYGKEIGGDLWEGKHTLILLHMLRAATPAERRRAHAILAKARPAETAGGRRTSATWADSAVTTARLETLVDELRREGELSTRGRTALRRALRPRGAAVGYKSEADVAFLRRLIDKYDSIATTRAVARRWAELASARLAGLRRWMPPSVHGEFLRRLTDFVVERIR
jgi:geranylgeranyl diphosphate synthase type II